jgi:hypothetical protein
MYGERHIAAISGPINDKNTLLFGASPGGFVSVGAIAA